MLLFSVIIYRPGGEAFSFFSRIDEDGHMILHCPRELPTRNKFR